ncbi:hypothetical protein VTI74DRAFT_11166 [Chaetomium olivicolor]
MSATAGSSSQGAAISSDQKTEKKHKRTKSDRKKKRARDEDEEAAVVEETPRKSKKTKSEDADQVTQPENSQPTADGPLKKKKKHREPEGAELAQDGVTKERKKSSKRAKEAEFIEPEPMEVDEPEAVPSEEAPKLGKKLKEKKSKKQKSVEDEQMEGEAEDDGAGDEPDKKKKRKSKDRSKEALSASQELQATQDSVADGPTASDFPFFTQTISLYVPFFPVGFDKPLTNVASQHLDPLLNHYSPTLRGVLLSYSNLNLSDRPAKASITHPPTDQTPALLHSIDEYAVGFGWLTFDAHLFVPSRGKWMEGVVQLQSEGHIGVVCWNKFNASIEAKRLPKGWKWVDLSKAGARQNASSEENEEEKEDQEEDILDGEELQVVEQIHTTGYWVNERGRKVSGKLRFRIKNFDVGLAGDYGYLSIEGTCLDDDTERALAAQERETERARRAKHNPAGLLRPLSRRVPEFSMTRFGKEDQEEDGGQRTVLYKGSRPGTPDD